MSVPLDLILNFKKKSVLIEACVPSSVCLLTGGGGECQFRVFYVVTLPRNQL